MSFVAASPRRSPSSIVLAMLVSLLVLGALAFTLAHLFLPGASPPNAAENVATAFYTAVKQQNYSTAYNLLADEQQAKITQYSFNLVAQEDETQNGQVTTFHEIRYDRDTNHANEAEIQMSVTRTSSGTYTVKLTMIQAPDGSWKILEEDRPI